MFFNFMLMRPITIKSLVMIQLQHKYHDHTMERKNQNKYYPARVVTLMFMLVIIYQICSSNHISQTHVSKQSMCCTKFLPN